MRNFVLALAILALSVACAPQASGPPATGGDTTTTSSQGVSSPEPAPATEAPASPGASPAAAASPGELPAGHPPMGGGVTPPPGHMGEGGTMNVTETEGAVVEAKGEELFLSTPKGVELKFYIPKDVKILPEGKTQADLKEGTRVKIAIRQVDRGMETETITIEDLPPATR